MGKMAKGALGLKRLIAPGLVSWVIYGALGVRGRTKRQQLFKATVYRSLPVTEPVADKVGQMPV